MSMFDREPNFTSVYEPDSGKKFIIWEAEYIGSTKHPDFGDNQKATLTVSEVSADNKDTGDKKTFSVYGTMADQIRRMDADDLPALCHVVKEGRANVITLITKELPQPF